MYAEIGFCYSVCRVELWVRYSVFAGINLFIGAQQQRNTTTSVTVRSRHDGGLAESKDFCVWYKHILSLSLSVSFFLSSLRGKHLSRSNPSSDMIRHEKWIQQQQQKSTISHFLQRQWAFLLEPQ